jgi:predicted protein tyrosine phosphatase
VTGADRRLAIVAAAVAGPRAATLLARLQGPGAAAAAALAGRLGAAPRAERLRALAEELAPDPREVRARADAAASLERAAVARLLAALPAGAEAGRAPALLVRLCRERVAT